MKIFARNSAVRYASEMDQHSEINSLPLHDKTCTVFHFILFYLILFYFYFIFYILKKNVFFLLLFLKKKGFFIFFIKIFYFQNIKKDIYKKIKKNKKKLSLKKIVFLY